MFLRKTSYGYFVRSHDYRYIVILAPNGYWFVYDSNDNYTKFPTFNNALDYIYKISKKECST